VANIRLHHLERLLRHPACALSCAAAIAALALVLVSARVLPLLGGIVATLVIGCVGPWIAVRGATMTITWDRRRARVGDTLTATLTRRSLLPCWRPQVAVRWPAGEQDATVNDAAAADGRAERVAVVPHRRGRFPRSAPALETSQPFGVVTARRAIPLPEPVIVWPAQAAVRVPAGLVTAAGVGRETSERITGHSGDPIGARDYRAGDSMRSIHWAHTARRDTLVVRERPGTAAAVVRLVVDHRVEGSSGEAGAHDRTLDAIVAAAFAIIESWLPRGVVFEIIWPGRAPVTPRTGSEITALLDELACLEPLSATNALLAISTQHRPRPVDLEIFLTTPSGRESLPAAVGAALCARHERLWIVVGGEPARTGAPPGRGRGERVVPVPLEPDPIAAVDAAFAALNHDTDTSPRNRASSKRRSYAPT
jgi:uncharacterized protein (DUF58 family)